MQDNFRHKGLRKQLVTLLKEKGITDVAVLAAIEKIPRHLFLDTAFVEFAYNDVAFPIGAGQTISQPFTVAFQTQLLEIKKNDKVLEIGTGSGYQTSVLCELGARVFSIERQKTLFQKTKILLAELNYSPKLFFGDGYLGQPSFAPFNKIIVTAVAPFIPPALIEQLAINGKLIIPVGEGESQIMTEITKDNSGKLAKKTFGEFKFVPLLEEKSN
jgi:protein-L-isoaspartate(D-aspartate) O-methyltransferase